MRSPNEHDMRPQTPAPSRRASGYALRSSLGSSLRAQPLMPTECASPRPTPGWSTFQPAQVVHSSTGLDREARC